MANNLTEFGRKSQALNINSTCRWVQLHDGDPGVDGQANKLGSPQSIQYDGSDAKLRAGLSESVVVPEYAVSQGVTITHVSMSVTSSASEASLVIELPSPVPIAINSTVRITTIQIQTL